MRRYNRWARKQASTAQCSPALMAAAMIGGLVIISYVYFQIILTTVLIVLACVMGIAIVTGVALIIRQMYRWNRKVIPVITRDQEMTPAFPCLSNPVISKETGPGITEDQQSLKADADTLADDVLELAWSPDGKTLISRKIPS